jgi:hypothetical protein
MNRRQFLLSSSALAASTSLVGLAKLSQDLPGFNGSSYAVVSHNAELAPFSMSFWVEPRIYEFMSFDRVLTEAEIQTLSEGLPPHAKLVPFPDIRLAWTWRNPERRGEGR